MIVLKHFAYGYRVQEIYAIKESLFAHLTLQKRERLVF